MNQDISDDSADSIDDAVNDPEKETDCDCDVLQEKVTDLESKLNDLKDVELRAYAELENFKKEKNKKKQILLSSRMND